MTFAQHSAARRGQPGRFTSSVPAQIQAGRRPARRALRMSLGRGQGQLPLGFIEGRRVDSTTRTCATYPEHGLLIEKYGYAPLDKVREMGALRPSCRPTRAAAHLAQVYYAGSATRRGASPALPIRSLRDRQATCRRVNLCFMDHGSAREARLAPTRSSSNARARPVSRRPQSGFGSPVSGGDSVSARQRSARSLSEHEKYLPRCCARAAGRAGRRRGAFH